MVSKIYAFVGIPARETMYGKVITDSSKVEQELDDMMDTLDASRNQRKNSVKFVWATYDSSKVTYEKACADFGRYMAHCLDKLTHDKAIDNHTSV